MKNNNLRFAVVMAALFLFEAPAETRLVPGAKGWASNSVNTVVFRRNSVVSHKDTQYVAFYNADGVVMLAKRRLGDMNWEVQKTPYRGKARDARYCQ